MLFALVLASHMLNSIPKNSQLSGISHKTHLNAKDFTLSACVLHYCIRFIFFPNYSLCILDSKVRDDKIRAREMNQIKHSYNIIGLYTEFCYSKTGCSAGL